MLNQTPSFKFAARPGTHASCARARAERACRLASLALARRMRAYPGRFLFFSVFFLSPTIVAQAQIARIEPATPRWGEKMTIIYDAGAKGAKLAVDDEVYVAIRYSFPGRIESRWAPMIKRDAQFHCELPVKENLNGVAVQFVTPNGGWDDQAFTTASVNRADGKPARGALESKIQSKRYREFFEQEIELYPENFSAYRAKWATAALLEGDGSRRIIKSDLDKLQGRRIETAELLSVLSTGNLMLAREEKSMELIRRAYEKFPSDPYTASAIADYERLVEELGLPADGKSEIEKIKKAVITRNPQTEFARAAVTALAEDRKSSPATLPLIEAVSQAWIAASPDHPMGYYNLARTYEREYQKPEIASELIEKAIVLLRAGKLRLYGDVNGKQTERLTLNAYLSKAELASRLGKNEAALSALATAKQLSSDSDQEGRAWVLEARILGVLRQEDQAERSFLEAWRRGSREAEDRLKARYKEKRGNLQGFDEYLLGKGKPEKTVAEWKLPAPQFRVSSLDGKSYDLKSLRGKIVVLNMWFIGCGPCRKEIPRLNEVVMEFKNRDVVFLAPSPDLAESLKPFLKKTPFDYSIVPAAERILDQFNIATFPTHIVIDREGQVELMLTGARERAPEEVRRVLLKMFSSN
jgi:peroxiredoxin